MVVSIQGKLGRELASFYSLALMNIGLAAAAMAVSVGFAMENLLFLVRTLQFSLMHIMNSLVWFAGFILSLRWLMASIQLMDGLGSIRDSYRQSRGQMSDEHATRLIIEMMAYYREKKPVVSTLSTASKLAGVCFIVIGSAQLLIVAVRLALGLPNALDVAVAISGVGSFLVSISSIAIPTYFGRYCATWDNRLSNGDRAEGELKRLLDGK